MIQTHNVILSADAKTNFIHFNAKQYDKNSHAFVCKILGCTEQLVNGDVVKASAYISGKTVDIMDCSVNTTTQKISFTLSPLCLINAGKLLIDVSVFSGQTVKFTLGAFAVDVIRSASEDITNIDHATLSERLATLQTTTNTLNSNITQNTSDIATLQTTTANLTVSVNNEIAWAEKASTSYPCGWRTGYYDTNNEGAIHSSYKYMSSTGFWNFPDGYTVTVTPPNGYEVRYLIFNSNNEYTDVCSDYSDNLIFTASSDNYYRFTVRGFNNDSNTKYNDSTFVNSIAGSVSKISLKARVENIETKLNNLDPVYNEVLISVNNEIAWEEKASTSYPCGWRTGYYHIETGLLKSTYNYMSSTGFWNFPDGYTVTVTPPNGYEVRYTVWNSNGEYTGQYSAYSTVLTFIASSDNYYRFTIRGFNNDANTKFNDSTFVNSIIGSVSKISLKEKVTDIEARLNNPSEKNVKILAIGNSWCRDSVRWLWTILNEAGYNAKIVQPYMGGANLYDMYFGINDESYTYTHSTWQQKTHDTYQTWTYTSDNPVYNPSNSDYANGRNGVGLTLQEIVDSDTWDYVLILGNRRQTARNTQYVDSTLANTYTVDGNEITETWNMNDFIAKIKSWCENTPKVFYMTAWSIAENTTGQHWTDAINTYYNTEWVQAEQDRTAFYELINENITKALKYGMYHMGNNIDGFVDLAKALYYARQDTYLSQFGFEMQRAETNSHLSEGLPMYLCSFTIANCLFGIQPNDVFTMPDFSSGSNADTDTGDTAVSNIQASKGLLYLARCYGEKANYNPFG